MKQISASAFKTRCLAVLGEVAKTGETWTILKRGKPIAQLTPAVPQGAQYPQDTLRRTVDIVGDIVTPVTPSDWWEAEKAKP